MAEPQTQSNRAPMHGAPAKTSNRVVVACKLPHGLLTQLYELGQTEDKQPIMVKTGDPVQFNGANSEKAIGGYGLTEIDADYWEAWSKQHHKFVPLKAGLIFAHERREYATSKAIDQAKANTGFEPIDPNKPAKGIERVPEDELKRAAAMGGA